jgi:hypothetical protein
MFMKNLKIILTAVAIVLFSLPLVYSTIVYVRPGKIIVHADYYPEGTTTADYNIIVRNDNDKPFNITFTVSSSLSNYVTLNEYNFTLDAGVERTVIMTVDLTFSSYKSGDVSVMFTPADGIGLSVPYSISIEMYPKGTNPQQPCEQPFCGIKPNCMVCSDLNGCYNGYYRKYDTCSNNQCVKTLESCSETCCDKYYNNSNAYCGEDGKCHSYTPHAPVIGSYSPTSLTPTVVANQTLKFIQVSSDEDGDTLTYTWFLDKIQKATTQNWTYSTVQGDVGTHNVTFVVSDSQLIDSIEWSVTVLSEPLKQNGESCTSNVQCQSGYCVHGTCRASSTYCGDNYCDSGETCSGCSSDCGTCTTTTLANENEGNYNGGNYGGATTTTKISTTTATTTVETTTPTTTIPTTTVEQTVEESNIPTGAFTLPSVLMNNWYFIPIPFVLVALIWKFYPRGIMYNSSKTSSKKGYVFVNIKPTETPVKLDTIKKQDIVNTEKKESRSTTIDKERMEQVRRKQIEDLRNRALSEDKKFK